MPVYKESPLEVAELPKGKVGRLCGRCPLQADDAETDVGLLNHGDVVSAVAYGRRQISSKGSIRSREFMLECSALRISLLICVLYKPDQLALLYRRKSACDDGRAALAHLQEVVLKLLRLHYGGHGLPVNHQAG